VNVTVPAGKILIAIRQAVDTSYTLGSYLLIAYCYAVNQTVCAVPVNWYYTIEDGTMSYIWLVDSSNKIVVKQGGVMY